MGHVARCPGHDEPPAALGQLGPKVDDESQRAARHKPYPRQVQHETHGGGRVEGLADLAAELLDRGGLDDLGRADREDLDRPARLTLDQDVGCRVAHVGLLRGKRSPTPPGCSETGTSPGPRYRFFRKASSAAAPSR